MVRLGNPPQLAEEVRNAAALCAGRAAAVAGWPCLARVLAAPLDAAALVRSQGVGQCWADRGRRSAISLDAPWLRY